MFRKKPAYMIAIPCLTLLASSAPIGGQDRVAPAAVVSPGADGALVELSPAEIAKIEFADRDRLAPARPTSPVSRTKPDVTRAGASIEAALHHSLAYYLDLPPETEFRFGPGDGDVYTVPEMIASSSLFLKTVRQPDSKLRAREIRRRFRVFESRNKQGATHYTGYYTPRLKASRIARSPADVPVFGPPADLVRVDIKRFVPEYSGPPIFGRVDGGRLTDYFTQNQILFERAIAASRALFYLNAGDFYHLQLQGGALISFPHDSRGLTPTVTDSRPPEKESTRSDARAVYYEYAADNGRDFQSPGKKFSVPRSELRRHARRDPKAFKTGLAKNPRYIFFQAQSHGPSGSLKTPLTPARSLAMDSTLVPGGVPAFVMTDSRTHTLHRFAVVQDTGNAIRGHGRVDFYWGDDETAERRATRFKQNGRVFLFVARK